MVMPITREYSIELTGRVRPRRTLFGRVDWRGFWWGVCQGCALVRGSRPREMNVETTMNDIERYEQAKLAVDAGSALYLLEAAATLLEQLPHVDSRLHRLESTLTKRLREEQQRMLDVMDRAHSKAGTPRPWPR